jgi:hypothetical protein
MYFFRVGKQIVKATTFSAACKKVGTVEPSLSDELTMPSSPSGWDVRSGGMFRSMHGQAEQPVRYIGRVCGRALAGVCA